MTLGSRDMVTKMATQVYKDPTATTREKQLAKAWLLHVTGRLPDVKAAAGHGFRKGAK